MRTWLLTSTTYGTWLPGDDRGFVGQVWEHRQGDEVKPRVRHADPATPYDAAMPGLTAWSAQLLKCEPVFVTQDQAAAVLVQFQETAQYRGWSLLAVSIMSNHFHLVVSVPDDPEPSKILGDLKSYASRRLSQLFGQPTGRWWTERGSMRKLPDERAVLAAIRYVLFKQPNSLVVWHSDDVKGLLASVGRKPDVEGVEEEFTSSSRSPLAQESP